MFFIQGGRVREFGRPIDLLIGARKALGCGGEYRGKGEKEDEEEENGRATKRDEERKKMKQGKEREEEEEDGRGGRDRGGGYLSRMVLAMGRPAAIALIQKAEAASAKKQAEREKES